MGTTQTQNPSMLDNVSSQDFTAIQSQHVASPTTTPPLQPQSQQTDNTTPQTTYTNPSQPTHDPEDSYVDPLSSMQPTTPSSTQSPSGPVNPPQPLVTAGNDDHNASTSIDEPDDENSEPTGYLDALAKEVEDALGTDNLGATPTPSGSEGTSGSSDKNDDTPVDLDKLSAMKKQALDHLEPLVKHLDQKPEEEFKTTMMMIQANDNHTLLEKALAAAKKIENDQERAQAMLDIVNEINYFSQNNSAS